MKEPIEKQPETPAGTGEEQAKETVNRRRMFGVGLIGVASMLAAACSGTDFASGNSLGAKRKKNKDENGGDDVADGPDTDSPDPGGPEGGSLDVNDPDDPTNVPEVTGLDDCAANVTTSIDPNADDIGALKPTVKFYGRMDSALVALKFPGGDAIDQVILASPEGKLLAVHTVTGADKDASGNYRPIVMDNVWLKVKGKDLTDVRIILQTPSGKKGHNEKIVFFTTFNGKPVLDLAGRTVPAGVLGHQSVTQFSSVTDKGNTNFKSDQDVKYPAKYNGGDAENRFLQTAQANTTWSKGAGVKGTVTDIMGETINIDGQGILEHQVFCTYDDSGANVVRTILHIG